MRCPLGAGVTPPDLTLCHAGCVAKPEKGAPDRLKTVQTIESRNQQRTGILAWRLAEAQAIRELTGEFPLPILASD